MLSLMRERSHQAGRRWKISGSVVAAIEPFLLSVSDDIMTLWDQRDGGAIQDATLAAPVVKVIAALMDIQAVRSKFIVTEETFIQHFYLLQLLILGDTSSSCSKAGEKLPVHKKLN